MSFREMKMSIVGTFKVDEEKPKPVKTGKQNSKATVLVEWDKLMGEVYNK